MFDPLSPLKEFFQELKRRHVIRVGGVYLVVAWLLIEVSAVVFPALQLPPWTTTLVVVLSLFGFPLAVIVAWAFEMTPEGIRRTPPPKPSFAPPEEEDVGGLLRRLSRPWGRDTGAGSTGDGSVAGSGSPPTSAGAVASSPPDVAGGAAAPGSGRDTRDASRTGAEPGGRISTLPDGDRAEAPDAERVRRASLAKLRHDLRSPINAVVGYAEMLLEEGAGDRDPETGADLRKIRAAGKELQGVVDEVLDPDAFDRLEERTGDAVEEFSQDLQHRLRTPLNAVIGYSELIVEREEEAGGRVLGADVEKILRAGRQLLDRTDEIVRFCTAQARGRATDSDYARVSSIAREALSRIRPVDPGGPDQVTVTGASLLVVDDSELNRDLLTRRLALQGYTVSTARDGREGLERMRSQPYDLVLLDILMPEINGLEVLTRMKSDEELREIPVIMISSLDEVDTAVRCIQGGAADFVSKPFDPVLLSARVAAALRTSELHGAARRSREQLQLQEELVGRVLYSRFPDGVARRIRRGETEIADRYEQVTLLCVRLLGLSAQLARGDAVDGLRRLRAVRSWMREVAAEHDVDTLVFSGLECLAVAGIPDPRPDHAEAAAGMALRMLEAGAAEARETGLQLRLRIGLHTGPVTAGVVGDEALAYEVWGETVEMARALETAGVAEAVHVSAPLRARLQTRHVFESRGVVSLGERGQVRTFLMRGEAVQPA